MADALTATDLSVRHGPHVVIDGVSLVARFGEITALIGPNGAGKSTLLRALTGILPSRGSILITGCDLHNLPPRERARTVAYVPQHSQLNANMRVRDVVAQGRFAHRATFGMAALRTDCAIDTALADAQISPLADRLFTQLSGGEQRRVLLARALATEARVLLLDEPTAGLDVAHAIRCHTLLRSLAGRGFAILSVLHDLVDVYHHADRAVLLSKGRIQLAGRAREVVASPALAQVYGVTIRGTLDLPFELAKEPR